jgi:hypothetical protein
VTPLAASARGNPTTDAAGDSAPIPPPTVRLSTVSRDHPVDMSNPEQQRGRTGKLLLIAIPLVDSDRRFSRPQNIP